MFDFLKRKKEPPCSVSVVVAAAGGASRMNGVNKLAIPIGGIPVLARSIMPYMECPRVSEIVIVCREEDIADYYHMVQDFELDLVTKVVAGGEQRQDSVFAGIAACNPEAMYFAIHDGARPFTPPELIDNCISAAIEYGAAALGVPVKDTIKVRGDDGMVTSTPDRSRLWGIQTPQIFEAGIYRAAMAQATHYRRTYTDDCQLVEQTGRKVFIAEGSYENIKITTPEDIAIAHAILAYREGDLGLFVNDGLID